MKAITSTQELKYSDLTTQNSQQTYETTFLQIEDLKQLVLF